jgi:hypothetical protein
MQAYGAVQQQIHAKQAELEGLLLRNKNEAEQARQASALALQTEREELRARECLLQECKHKEGIARDL